MDISILRQAGTRSGCARSSSASLSSGSTNPASIAASVAVPLAPDNPGDDGGWTDDLGPGRGRAPAPGGGYSSDRGSGGGGGGYSSDRQSTDGGYGTPSDRFAAGSYRETNRRGRPPTGPSDGRDRLADPILQLLEFQVRLGGRLLDDTEGGDEASREADPADREVLGGTLRLRGVASICRNTNFAE